VNASWPTFLSNCKTRLSALGRSCFLGRASAQEKCRNQQRELRLAHAEAARRTAEHARCLEQLRQLQQRNAELEAELARPRPVTLPLGAPPPGMSYGAGLIELCLNLARKIGLRPTVRALTIFFRWLGATVELPVYQTIRLWLQRLGLDRMQRTPRAEGGVWIVDHTNQIGKEKVLAVLRVPDHRPRAAGPLRQEELEVLAVLPGTSWKREDVLEVYQQTAQQYGVPRAIASDGAAELQEPIGWLGELLPKTPGKKRTAPLALRDPKHFLANQLEALLARDPAWQEFTQRLGSTRSAVQQTELAHFTPPALKLKARFMNLAATLRWANTVLWHLERPESQSRHGITVERWEEKLGWLRAFAPQLCVWQACQDVVSTALTFLNKRGLFRGAAKQLRQRVAKFARHALSKRLMQALLKFVRAAEGQLRRRERLSLSTEILESSFAQYKQLEQQHAKGGFTSLLLALPVLLRPTTAAEITASMQSSKVADVQAWQQQHLPTTLAARRQRLYREAKPQRRRERKKCATPNNTSS
jgi:hypothetical protein